MITTNNEGWLVSDCEPVIEKTDECEPLILFKCTRPEDIKPGQDKDMLLRPARSYIEQAYPEWNYGLRSNAVRSAVTQFIRSKWGPFATDETWSPCGPEYEESRDGLNALFRHKLWERFTVIGRLLHVSLPKREVGLTVDFVVMFNNGDGIGLFAVWNKDQRIDPNCAWAELGAAALAFEDSGIPISKLVVIWINNADVEKIDVKAGRDAGVNECICLFFDVLKEVRRKTPKRIESAVAVRTMTTV